jgi:hypothetical protein
MEPDKLNRDSYSRIPWIKVMMRNYLVNYGITLGLLSLRLGMDYYSFYWDSYDVIKKANRVKAVPTKDAYS